MNDVETLLERMRREEAITDLDACFARLMLREDKEGGAPLSVASALASAASTRGETSATLEEIASRAAPWIGSDSFQMLERVLFESPVSGDGGAPTPLVIDSGRVYLYRYWDYERRLAKALVSRNRSADDAPSNDWIRERLEVLFEDVGDSEIDWQKVAAALAMIRQLTIISGGPGTGKTTTVVRLLALMLEHAGAAGCRIALAAPTGKAAARMQQAIEAARATLPVTDAVRKAIPDAASTIHRLLGVRAHGRGFRHDAENPLAIDLLVVDEVSMVDLALMTRLMEAVPRRARVVLMGDRDQLASVEPGSVFADLCLGADGFSEVVSAQLREATGYSIESSAVRVLGDACVLLKRSYRFRGDSGIGRLAAAVKQGDVSAVTAAFEDDASAGVVWRDVRRVDELEHLVDGRVTGDYGARLRALSDGAGPAELFAQYAGLQMLCAVRRGPFGVAAMNAAVERALAAAGLIDPGDPWYPGRPVIVTANDYGLGLFNGDMCLILPHPVGGRPSACFKSNDGEYRWLHPARLPEHATAWALTVHKSQGSEFDEVLVVLPDEDAPLLTAELLYTALTRAKQRAELWASSASLRRCVARRVTRESGLPRRIAAN